jgi:hypothetical protein
MSGPGRAALLLGLGGSLALAGIGCEKSVTYSYYDIHVVLDRQSIDDDLLDIIQGCAVLVETPLRQDSADLRCVRHRVPNDLGVFQYTSNLSSGSLLFTVIMTDFDNKLVAQGDLGPIGVAPGSAPTDETLVVKALAVVPPPAADAGAGDLGDQMD